MYTVQCDDCAKSVNCILVMVSSEQVTVSWYLLLLGYLACATCCHFLLFFFLLLSSYYFLFVFGQSAQTQTYRVPRKSVLKIYVFFFLVTKTCQELTPRLIFDLNTKQKLGVLEFCLGLQFYFFPKKSKQAVLSNSHFLCQPLTFFLGLDGCF